MIKKFKIYKPISNCDNIKQGDYVFIYYQYKPINHGCIAQVKNVHFPNCIVTFLDKEYTIDNYQIHCANIIHHAKTRRIRNAYTIR